MQVSFLKSKSCSSGQSVLSSWVSNLKAKEGFTLVELMVSITIFMVITSITLTNYPRFSNKLSLDLLAEDIALSLREAQIFGSSVLGVSSGQSKVFGAYGVHFEKPILGSANYDYLIYADVGNSVPGVREYNGPSSSDLSLSCLNSTVSNECVKKFTITGRNKVKALCSNFEKFPREQRVVGCQEVNVLDVTFVRPNLDAKFTIKDASLNILDSTNVSSVGIVLESPGGEYYRTIVVWKTGQISVE